MVLTAKNLTDSGTIACWTLLVGNKFVHYKGHKESEKAVKKMVYSASVFSVK
ncbi:MAG: hypothetical protein LH478_07320 [Chitinophagaceae bacterium]|nr:hypothetical protein [Chitinophagaceae bacterium]